MTLCATCVIRFGGSLSFRALCLYDYEPPLDRIVLRPCPGGLQPRPHLWGGPPEPAPPTPTTPAATASASHAIHLGEPISAPEVALADVAKDPSSFTGRAFTTHGTVTAVCQEMGCWMEIKDASNGAHLRMHGHSFFVPKTANGRQARVQATLLPSGAAKACADDECASKNLALLQLDATGVELD